MYAASAFINSIEQFIRCSFVINNSIVITEADTVSLKIANITNPKTIDNYGITTDFTIKTLDSLGAIYDKSLSCMLNSVKLATYTSLFSQT